MSWLRPLAALLLAFAACTRADSTSTRPEPASGEGLHIVVITHGQAADPFWSVVKRGVEDAAEQVGARVDYRAPDTFDMVRMARLVEGAVAAQPDGIALSLPDADALTEPVAKARAAGIPVISLNSGGDRYRSLGIPVHIGQDEREAGRLAGERMKRQGVKKALCVNQEVGNLALDRRCEGFSAGLNGAVEVVAVDLDPTKTKTRLLAMLEKHEPQGILTLGPTSAEPVLAALEAANEKVVMGTFDLSPAVIEAIATGRLDFALDQQQYLQGYLPVVLLATHARTGAFPRPIQTGPGFVTRETAAAVRGFTKAGVR